MPSIDPGHVAGHGPDRVERRGERPHALDGHATPGGLQPDGAAAGRRGADGAGRVAADGEVDLAAGQGDRVAAGAAAGDQRRVERVDRRAEVRVDAGAAAGQLVQVGLAHDGGVGGPQAGQARRVRQRRRGQVGQHPRQPAVVGVPATSMRSLMATRGPCRARPGGGSRCSPVRAEADATCPVTRASSRGPRALSHPLRTLFAWSSTSSSPSSGPPPSSPSPTWSAPVPRGPAAPRPTSGMIVGPGAAGGPPGPAGRPDGGPPRAWSASTRSPPRPDMAAKMAGEKLGDSMTSGSRQLDLRTTAFEKRVEGLTGQLERLGDVVTKLQQDGAAAARPARHRHRAGHHHRSAPRRDHRPPPRGAGQPQGPRPVGRAHGRRRAAPGRDGRRASPTASRRASPAGRSPTSRSCSRAAASSTWT